jgi:lipoprotein-releasing system permease protein
MFLQIKLAIKYLSKRGSYFFSVSNLIAFLGIIIGLFCLNIVSSVMNGLQKNMTKQIVETKFEVKVYNKDYSPIIDYQQIAESLVNDFPEVITASAVNKGEFLLRKKNYTQYTENYGVDFLKHEKNSKLFQNIFLGYPDEESFKANGIILGSDLAWNIVAGVGDTIDVVSPLILIPTPFGLIPKIEPYKVVGIFNSEFQEFDMTYSYIDIENSKKLRTKEGIDFLELKTNITDYNYRKLVNKIEEKYPNLVAEHWEIYDKTLFQAIQIEKIAMFVVMSIILVLASFNITGNFIRTISEKRDEIAILKAIGMTKKDIRKFCLIMGITVGFSGIVIADLLSFFVLKIQLKYEYFKIPVPGFPFNVIPVDLSFLRILLFSALCLIICIIGTIYPTNNALKINIIEVLNEEKQN